MWNDDPTRDGTGDGDPYDDAHDGAGDADAERVPAALAPEQREAFLLKHVEQLSYEEMSEATGAGVSALKMRVKRACERLQRLMAEVRVERR